MVKVNKTYLAQACKGDLKTMERLDLSKQDVHKVAGLEACTSLVRLDLSHNKLTSLEGVAPCHTLKWLSAADNQTSSIACLQQLTELQVLNLASNALAGSVDVSKLTALGALILNSNQVTSLLGLQHLPRLNTIVLKDNSVTDLGSMLAGCGQLLKLSLGHNSIADLGSSLKSCTSLAELRLGHNKLQGLPSALKHNAALKILDLGSNLIMDFDAIKVLKKLPELVNLTLKGCPISEQDGYAERMLGMLPTLEILDGRRVREPHRRPKRPTADPAADTAADAAADAAAVGQQAQDKQAERAKRSVAAGADADQPDLTGQGRAAKTDALLKPAKRRKADGEVQAPKAAPLQADVPASNRPPHKKRKLAAGISAGEDQGDHIDDQQMQPDIAAREADPHPSAAEKPSKNKKRRKKGGQQDTGSLGLQTQQGLGSLEPLSKRLAAAGKQSNPSKQAVAALEADGKRPASSAAAAAQPAVDDPVHFSGVVGVFEAEANGKSSKHKRRDKQGSTGPIRGAAVAQLLTAAQGLTPVEVGLGGAGAAGGWSAWDDTPVGGLADTASGADHAGGARKKHITKS